jgi:hypothetical protein
VDLKRGGKKILVPRVKNKRSWDYFLLSLFFFPPLSSSFSFSLAHWLVIVGCGWSYGGFERGRGKPGFTQFVSVFTVKIMRVICYFVDFPDVAGRADPVVGYDHCSVEFIAVFCLCGLYGYC